MSLLSESLRDKLIPWSQHNAPQRLIVARPKMSAAQMPDGVTLSRRKIVGPRVIVKNRREYGNVRGRTANWPEANMQEWEHNKIICVLAGRFDLHVGNCAVQCGEGFFLLTPPGIPQIGGAYRAKGNFCETLNIISHHHAVQCFIAHSHSDQERGDCRENYLFKNQRLTEIFRMVMEELIEDRPGAKRIGSDLLAAFWASLQREVEEERYITPGPIGRPQTLQRETSSDFKAELLNYVQRHLNQTLTLESAARGMYLSRAQFSRRVRRETGKSFIQFLTDYRIEEAAVLLRDSDWTVSAIAGFLGFKEPAYFQTVFRRTTGQTPSQYRESIRKMR